MNISSDKSKTVRIDYSFDDSTDFDSLMLKRIEEERSMREIVTRIQAKLDRGELIGVSKFDSKKVILYTEAELQARIMD